MFLSECLKKCDPNMKVGWFLHTPFPSSEIYGTLPSRSEFLRSVLATDVVNHSVLIIMFFFCLNQYVLADFIHMITRGTLSTRALEFQGKLTRVAAVRVDFLSIFISSV